MVNPDCNLDYFTFLCLSKHCFVGEENRIREDFTLLKAVAVRNNPFLYLSSMTAIFLRIHVLDFLSVLPEDAAWV